MLSKDIEIDEGDVKEDEDEMSTVDLASRARLRISGIPVLINKGMNRHDHVDENHYDHNFHNRHDHDDDDVDDDDDDEHLTS